MSSPGVDPRTWKRLATCKAINSRGTEMLWPHRGFLPSTQAPSTALLSNMFTSTALDGHPLVYIALHRESIRKKYSAAA